MVARKTGRGVPDWSKKLVVIEEVLGAVSKLDIADKVFPEDSQRALSVWDNFRKWQQGRPRRRGGPGEFFDRLPAVLGCASSVTAGAMIRSSITAFVEFLPVDVRPRAWHALEEASLSGLIELSADERRAAGKVGARPEPPPDDVGVTLGHDMAQHFHSLMIPRRWEPEPLRHSLDTGRIDQKHYYMTLEAASAWTSLVRSESYPTYDHCKAGLRALVNSPGWRTAISESRPRAVVMLAGGGAPTKDLVIINGLLGGPEQPDSSTIHYFLVDISPFMLLGSKFYLEDALRHVSGGGRVDVITVWKDVVNLHPCNGRTFRRGGPILFGITGGTVGNLSETAFFRSLEGVSRPGDLLIISADTLSGSEEELRQALINKYDHNDLYRFISPAVRALAGELDLPGPISALLGKIRVALADQSGGRFSDVEGSLSVTLSLSAADREINLLSSARYQPEALIDFAAEWGWEPLEVMPSPLNPHFVQFFFRRKKVEIPAKTRAAYSPGISVAA